ncbi:hypothetical protein [Paracidovorax cattleyae]|uniref:Uncharacterized protein n=1 Tax=Paracidovorax cattleyae TaxID=80868 RepID=A0A1H0T919_9BURK|nr:hypothetical protein [Paracidovorax cattleyae]SDP50514.1 hypothetical protein SAMN04489708_11487 [Paracidovorax cattleyae]
MKASAATAPDEAADTGTVAVQATTTATEMAAAPIRTTDAPPAESLDAQCERAVAATWVQLADCSLKVGDVLSAAGLKRQHGVSDQGAAMAFEQLKFEGLLQGWGTTAKVSRQALMVDTAARAAQTTHADPGPAPASASADSVPPWLALRVKCKGR